MSRHDVTEVTDTMQADFEAPELTVIGEASDVVLGIPFSGWDHRGMGGVWFEFESDTE